MRAQHDIQTVEQFDKFTALPENSDHLFEYIAGEVVEVPSNPRSSEIAITIAFHLKLYLRQSGRKGRVTGEAGGYQVSGERYAPDVALLLDDAADTLVSSGYHPHPPTLAVEIISPTDQMRRVNTKISNYLAAGTVVWVAYPDQKVLTVHQSGHPVRVYGEHDVLDGGALLAGFTLNVVEVFE
jgi:Uma2 family endonuclease